MSSEYSYMTLGKLRDLCQRLIDETDNGVDENTRIAVSSDEEGNSYGFVSENGSYSLEVLTDEYNAEIASGDLSPTDEIPENCVAAVIFYP